MNRRIKIGLILFAVLFAVILGFWLQPRSGRNSTPPPIPVAVSPRQVPPARLIPSNVFKQIQKASLERSERMEHALDQKQSKFYGKVIDETGAPLVGAKVLVSPVERNAKSIKNSDENGRFIISAIPPSATVFVLKGGFRPAIQANGQFTFDAKAKHPSYSRQDTPVVFVLRKI